MKRRLLILFIVISCLVISADEYTDFQKYAQEQRTAFKNYMNWERASFSNYRSTQDSLFIQYKDDIERNWGEFIESTPNSWVTYNSDFTTRTEVDYEKEVVKVEVIVEDSDSDSLVDMKLAGTLKKIMDESDDTEGNILDNQIANPENKNQAINIIEVDEVIKSVPKEEKIVNNKKICVINLELIPESIQKRVEKYKDVVIKYCRLAGVEPALALSIIQTESSFNPKAYNREGNAYGMMQIVPVYAGKTMNKILNGRNEEPSSKELFDANTNLKYGIHYLGKLENKDWKKVSNKVNRRYCVICNYNGGAGAVYIALTGRTKKIGQERWDKMMNLLNSDNNKKVMNLLKEKSWEETRKYIVNVEKRYKNFIVYNEWM